MKNKADVVFGSRFIGAHRCFLFTHYLGNRIVNLIANVLYNTILTDLMTGYKVFKVEAIKEFPIKSNRFGFEAEITGIVFRKGLRVYEVPISYSGRNYWEGKKIKWKDVFSVIWWLLYTRFRPVRDIGLDTLDKLSYVQNYNSYIFEKFRPYLGKRVLELGAGTGNITRYLLRNRELVVAVDKSPDNLFHLSQSIPESSIFRTFRYDIENNSLLSLKKEFCFDSAVGINILEHIDNEKNVLKNAYELLSRGGYLVLVLPAHKRLFSRFDRLLGHRRRYNAEMIEKSVRDCGFCPERMEYFNILGALSWWLNFKIFKRAGFDSLQLFIFNHFVWLVKLTDRICNKAGISLLVIARKAGNV